VSIVAGLDGCPGGWVQVIVAADGQGTSEVMVVPDIDSVISNVDSGRLAAVGIDIPIGLPDSGSRRCDIDARRMIGPRRSSVFPAPARGLLGAETYDEAVARSRALSGKGISRQTFAILPKIDEVDLLITPDRQRHLVEVHPEVSFTILAGGPMANHKATSQGRAERLAVLRRVFPDIDEHAAKRIRRTRPDDVIDAYVAAWSARRWLAKTHLQLGGEVDRNGIRMEMIA
jgi:predicted RNase H-like nuclease